MQAWGILISLISMGIAGDFYEIPTYVLNSFVKQEAIPEILWQPGIYQVKITSGTLLFFTERSKRSKLKAIPRKIQKVDFNK